MFSVSKVNPRDAARIWSRLMSRITNSRLLDQNERLIKTWRFGDRPIHAGQVLSSRELPNGNKLTQIVTAFAGNNPYAVQGVVKSPSGELLRAYTGVHLNGEWKFTTSKNIDEVKTVANKIFNGNPEAQRLF